MHPISDPATYSLDQHRHRTGRAARNAETEHHRQLLRSARPGSFSLRAMVRLLARRPDRNIGSDTHGRALTPTRTAVQP